MPNLLKRPDDQQSVVKAGVKLSAHAVERMAERGVTPKMVEVAIAKGQKFWDPVNKSINYVLPNGFASGKSLMVATNNLSGEVRTVVRSSQNLVKSRYIAIP